MGPDTFSALLGALYRRRLTVLLVLAGALGSGAWFVATVPPLYQAKAVLFVRADAPRLALDSSAPSLPEGPVLPDSSEEVRVGMVGIASSQAAFERVHERIPEIEIAQLRKRVILDIDPAQQLVVLATDRDPALAVRLCNEFVQAVADLMREMSERHPLDTLAALRAEQPRAERAYLEAQDALLAYLISVGSADPAKDLQLLVEERQDLRAALADLDLEEQRLVAQRPVVERELAARPGLALARQTVVESAGYRAALSAVADARLELAVASARYRAPHQQVLALEARLAAAEQLVRDEAERGLEQLAVQYEPDPQATGLMERLVAMEVAAAGVAPARTELRGRLDQVQVALAGMPLNQAELGRLEHGIQIAKAHLQRVTERVAELELQLERGLEPVYFDPGNLASEEQLVELPSALGVMLFAGLGGLFGGLALALASELIAAARRQAPF